MRDAEPRLAPAARGAMLIIDEATLRDDEELPDDDALPDGYVVRGVRYPRPVARPASATKAVVGGGASRQERDIEDVRAVVERCIVDTSSEIDVSDDDAFDDDASDMDVSPIKRATLLVDPPLRPYEPPRRRRAPVLHGLDDDDDGGDDDDDDDDLGTITDPAAIANLIGALGLNIDDLGTLVEFAPAETAADADASAPTPPTRTTLLTTRAQLDAAEDDPSDAVLIDANFRTFVEKFEETIAAYNRGEGLPTNRERAKFERDYPALVEKYNRLFGLEQAKTSQLRTGVDYLEDPVTGGRRDPAELRRLNAERRRTRLKRSPRRFVPWYASPAELCPTLCPTPTWGFDWKSHPVYPPDLLRGD